MDIKEFLTLILGRGELNNNKFFSPPFVAVIHGPENNYISIDLAAEYNKPTHCPVNFIFDGEISKRKLIQIEESLDSLEISGQDPEVPFYPNDALGYWAAFKKT